MNSYTSFLIHILESIVNICVNKVDMLYFNHSIDTLNVFDTVRVIETH